MKTFKKIFFAISLFLLFFCYKNVLATNSIDQQQLGEANSYTSQIIVQTFKPATTNISGLAIKTLYGLVGGSVYVCSGLPDWQNLIINEEYKCNNHDLITSAININLNSGEGGLFFLNAGSIIPNQDYYFTISTTTDYIFGYKSQLNSSYNRGSMGACTSGICEEFEASDLYFKTYYNDLIYVVPATPTEGQEFNYNTINFTGTYNNQYFAYDNLIIQIYNKDRNYYIYDVSNILTGENNYSRLKYLADTGNYRYTAYLLNNDNLSFTIGTDEINFSLIGTSTQGQGIYTVPAFPAETCEGIATSTLIGELECALRKAINWAIVPDTTTLTDFKNNYEAYKDVFPFNTFFQIADIISDQATSTQASTTVSLGIPMINNINEGSDFYILPVIASTSMQTALGETNNNLYRTSIGYLLWIMTAGLIILELKKI